MILDEKRLMKRYLIWCYKDTKEDLDRINRYFTQHDVDENILKSLRSVRGGNKTRQSKEFQKKIRDFEQYKEKKHTAALNKKYSNLSKKVLNVEYLYLEDRLKSIEKSIIHFLGKKALHDIVEMYEAEMTSRILKATSHH